MSGREAMQKRTSRVGRWRPTALLGRGLVWCLRLLPILGIRPKENGWRRTANVFLRSQVSKFTLTAFGLDIWSDVRSENQEPANLRDAERHVAGRLAAWLRTQPAAHWQLEWARFSARRRRKTDVDITLARFASDGQLEAIDPLLDAESLGTESAALSHLGDDDRRRLHQTLVSLYNRTRELPDKRRPRVLERLLARSIDDADWGSTVSRAEAHQYIGRILSSSFVSFELLAPKGIAAGAEGRFQMPDFRRVKHPGFGLLNIHVRFDPALCWADVWMEIDHVAADGVPMQETLDALRNEWEVCDAPKFPAPTAAAFPPVRCSTPDASGSIFAQVAMLDFRNLLRARTRLNEKYRSRLDGGITVGSLLVWALGHHPAYGDKTFAVTVDVAEQGAHERVVGLVPIRPGDFFDLGEEEGFAQFVEEFNRRLTACRARTDPIHRLFAATAPLPPLVYALVAKLLPGYIAEAVGTVGVSIIKDAEIFVAPYNSLFTDGFLALGNLSLPTEEGCTTGAVSVKATEEGVRESHQALREVLDQAFADQG